jgi:hypothetical protein
MDCWKTKFRSSFSQNKKSKLIKRPEIAFFKKTIDYKNPFCSAIIHNNVVHKHIYIYIYIYYI